MGGKRGCTAMAICTAVALLAALLLSASGAEALDICNMDDKQLTDCIQAIHGPSPPAPSSTCCAALRTADLPCLCRYKGAVLLRSLDLDPKRAAALPGKCHIKTPPECTNGTPISLPLSLS
ncbi:hypothetical protein Taro_037802 [Colocasia esculenta]|uniref:Bifunctional inhibitor/plant lipid transfer protein/seed storage helical domain-containing protein n=1 Tax=Colocasia esculenta TaxID=4460 RepID=A0A843WKC1_COLES|nr:hypothetical protein [Colocasia esculenta]